MRVHQWIKNLFIFAPVIFSLHFFQFAYIKNSLIAIALFSLVAGCIYVFNDCFDKKMDELHPQKKNRPIASGKLSVPAATTWAAVIIILVMAVIFLFNPDFFIIALIYVGMNLLYSRFLKRIVILDVMVIAVGFVLRVQIGGVINGIELSPWILLITFLLAIFIGLVKRRQELVKILENNDEVKTRRSLKQYNLSLLDQLISISTSTTLISYIIYVLNPDIQEKFGTGQLYLTIPFVAFGIFRYLYLTYSKGKGENPAEVIFSDIPFTFNIILWLGVFVLIIV